MNNAKTSCSKVVEKAWSCGVELIDMKALIDKPVNMLLVVSSFLLIGRDKDDAVALECENGQLEQRMAKEKGKERKVVCVCRAVNYTDANKEYCWEGLTAQHGDCNQATRNSTKFLHFHRESAFGICEDVGGTATLPYSNTCSRGTWSLHSWPWQQEVQQRCSWMMVTSWGPERSDQKRPTPHRAEANIERDRKGENVVSGCINHYPVKTALGNSRRDAKNWERVAPPHVILDVP
ncbi:hypothetical protein EV401DRAFT_1893572 [Pisolithus croceorrhizus]|nr:hypothetical protein EV401DRAFT_1893572 [Pisolithus croceorrhizus]